MPKDLKHFNVGNSCHEKSYENNERWCISLATKKPFVLPIQTCFEVDQFRWSLIELVAVMEQFEIMFREFQKFMRHSRGCQLEVVTLQTTSDWTPILFPSYPRTKEHPHPVLDFVCTVDVCKIWRTFWRRCLVPLTLLQEYDICKHRFANETLIHDL